MFTNLANSLTGAPHCDYHWLSLLLDSHMGAQQKLKYAVCPVDSRDSENTKIIDKPQIQDYSI